ncbi:MAG: hypothetical protein V4820_11605 [Pseudomonadota bacterium]
MMRGLFGSSARQAAPFAPEAQGLMPIQAPEPLLASAGSPDDGPAVREYLGGLVKYEPQQSLNGGDRMRIIGASLRDAGAALQGGQGGSLDSVREDYRVRQDRAQKLALRQRLEAMIDEQYADDPQARAIYRADPQAFISAWQKKQEPTVVKGKDGIYERSEEGDWKRVAEFPEDERPAPMGMVRNADTGALEWEPGYVEAQGQLSGTRREAVVSRPMPTRARAGGGGGRGSSGGGMSGLPPGFVPD